MAEAESGDAALAVYLPVLQALLEWWEAEGIEGVIIGGLAVALLGRPRVTRDVDALILLDESRWDPFVKAGARFGFLPRLTDAVQFARESRVLLMAHTASGTSIDLTVGALPFELEVVQRAQAVTAGRLSLPTPAPEDLVVMKWIAHRPRDLVDVEGVLEAQSDLDVERIRRWVGYFAELLETPELFRDLDSALQRASAPGADGGPTA